MFIILFSFYCGLIFFVLYRIIKSINAPRRVIEIIYILVSSGILAFVIGLIRKDVGNILVTISTLLLTSYVILLIMKRKK